MTDEAEADRVLSLPGWGNITNFDLFSGYITVDEKRQRRLFYVLAECEHDPENAPLLLWLNGGPGCSSLGGGFLTELGPWYPSRDGKLQANRHSWNKFANLLFVEAPAFVGFSYSRDLSDKDVGDAGTAADNLSFLLGFLDRFPNLSKNQLWITGESYAGHYVPQLALSIILYNKCLHHQQQPGQQEVLQGCQSMPLSRGRHAIRLEGLSLGNAWTDPVLDNQGTVNHWWTHSMISDAAYQGIWDHCDFARSNPLDEHPDHRNPKGDRELCDVFCRQADSEIGSVDIYNMIADDCQPLRARGEAVALGRALARTRTTAGLGLQMSARKGTEAAVQRLLALRNQNSTLRQSSAPTHSTPSGTTASDGDQPAPLQHPGEEPGAARRDVDDARRHLSSRRQMRVTVEKRLGVGRSEQGRVGRTGGQVGSATAREEGGRGGAGDAGNSGSNDDSNGGSWSFERLQKYDPCIEDWAEIYLNLPEVQRALHANQSRDRVEDTWAFCRSSKQLRYHQEDLQISMIPLYDEMLDLKPDLRILLYSGDADASVPALGTRYWLEQLGLRETGVSWRTWSSSTGQVGGYLVTYKELTYATVRAAGHMVPYSQPERAHFLISHFIQNKVLPS